METHFAPKATATKRGTTSKSKQRQQIVHQQEIVHLSIAAPLRHQSNRNKSYILELGSKPKQRQEIVHLSIGKILRHPSNGITSYVSALGHRLSALGQVVRFVCCIWFGRWRFVAVALVSKWCPDVCDLLPLLWPQCGCPNAKMYHLLPLLWSRSIVPMLRCEISCRCFGLDFVAKATATNRTS